MAALFKIALKSAFGSAVAVGVLGAGQAQALTITLFNSFNHGFSSYRTYQADQGISWTTARNYATGLGGNWNLVSINSAGESAAIFSQIDVPQLWTTPNPTTGIRAVGPWIGLFQLLGSPEPAGDWLWVDGTTIASNGYSAWAPSEPNNGVVPAEDYGHFLGSSSNIRSANWNDAPDNPGWTVNSFVVETAGVTGVPGPLPCLGAASAFGFSRKLRKRIKVSKALNDSITAA